MKKIFKKMKTNNKYKLSKINKKNNNNNNSQEKKY